MQPAPPACPPIGRAPDSGTSHLVTVAVPGCPLRRAAARDAAGDDRVHGADRGLTHVAAAHGRHRVRAFRPRLRDPDPAHGSQDRTRDRHRHGAAELPVRHLRRHHDDAVPADPADPRRPGSRTDRDGRLQPALRPGYLPAAGRRLCQVRPPAISGQHDLGERWRHQPHRSATFLSLRHAKQASVRGLTGLDQRGGSRPSQRTRLPDPRPAATRESVRRRRSVQCPMLVQGQRGPSVPASRVGSGSYRRLGASRPDCRRRSGG